MRAFRRCGFRATLARRQRTAGLDLVREGAAMILDADGQDPPELVPQFVALA